MAPGLRELCALAYSGFTLGAFPSFEIEGLERHLLGGKKADLCFRTSPVLGKTGSKEPPPGESGPQGCEKLISQDLCLFPQDL